MEGRTVIFRYSKSDVTNSASQLRVIVFYSGVQRNLPIKNCRLHFGDASNKKMFSLWVEPHPDMSILLVVLRRFSFECEVQGTPMTK